MTHTSGIGRAAALVVVAWAGFAAQPAWAEPISTVDEPTVGKVATPSPSITAAVELFNARDFDGALRLLRTAAKENTNLPPAQVIMAQLFSESKDGDRMRSALQQATVDEPLDPEAFMLLGDVAVGDQDFVKAEELYQKSRSLLLEFRRSATRKSVLERRTRSGLASTAVARQDWVTAQSQLESLLRLDPQNGAAMHRLAACLLRQNDESGALEQLRRAAKAGPEVSCPEAELARLYQSMGDHKNVEKWLAAALTASPKDADARLAAGYWALSQGRTDEAQKHAIAATQIDPRSGRAAYFRGAVAMFQKDYPTAESSFRTALKRSPDNFSVINYLAIALIGQDDETKSQLALEYAEANARRRPKSPQAAATYAWVLYHLGRLGDAEVALREAAPAAQNEPDVAFVVACVAAARDRKAEAKQLLEATIKNFSTFMFRSDAQELLNDLTK